MGTSCGKLPILFRMGIVCVTGLPSLGVPEDPAEKKNSDVFHKRLVV